METGIAAAGRMLFGPSPLEFIRSTSCRIRHTIALNAIMGFFQIRDDGWLREAG